jgi:[acyl-carrier-protein] S-malonyltransferase
MRERIERSYPGLVRLAYHHVGEDPFVRPGRTTYRLQPAIFSASVAGWLRLRRDLPRPGYFAGHSLGEYAALVAAGSITVREGMRLVAARGRLMDWAATRLPDGAMLALLGCDHATAERIARDHGLTVANDNCPGQIVLTGRSGGIDAAAREARAAGIKATKLAIAGAFHSPEMDRIVPAFERVLATVDFREPRVEVMCSTTAEPFDDVPRRLLEGLTRPVRWRETVLALARRGVTSFVEPGPGKVLTRLVERTLESADAVALEVLEDGGA